MDTAKRTRAHNGKLCVLVVDDSDLVIDIVKFSLRSLPIEVLGADNPRHAMKFLEDRVFSMIITDIKMPGTNGFEFVSKLREMPEYRHTPVIVISGYEEEQYHRDAINIGAASYLQKPFTAEKIAEVVLSTLRREYRKH